MPGFEILCVTMNQSDFSKIAAMNVRSDIVFANQAGRMAYDETTFDGHTAKMVTTNTKGVGINRNIALDYATADICLFADDDVRYADNVEEIVLKEFAAHPDADVVFFDIDIRDSDRKLAKKTFSRTQKLGRWGKKPFGGCQIAVRLRSVRQKNLCFTTLFGGGCLFPSGEDSLWIVEATKKGLTQYASPQSIGETSLAESTWFTGFDERMYYGKGAFCEAAHKHTFNLCKLYYYLRTKHKTALSFQDISYWMNAGRKGYQTMISYETYQEQHPKR